MNYQELDEILKETGVPFTFHHWENPGPPPYGVYLDDYTENFAADNISYFEISHCNVEIYTRQRDPEVEKKIEKVLNQHEIYWDRMCSYIESESLYQTTYEIEV